MSVLTHVAFGPSATGALMAAMEQMGREDQVLCVVDDLSFGPIDPGDAHSRMQWTVDTLGFTDDPELERYIDESWQRVAAARTEIVVWTSTRYVTEYCGLLELLRRVTDVPISVVDVGGLVVASCDGDPWVETSFASVPDTVIVEHKLLDRRVAVTAGARERWLAEWHQMRSDNAPLRTVTHAGLASVPLDHYDATIRSFIGDDWKPARSVIAEAIWEGLGGPHRQCTDHLLLLSRLMTLVDDGVIEAQTEVIDGALHLDYVRRVQ